jgi:hypothetical protein
MTNQQDHEFLWSMISLTLLKQFLCRHPIVLCRLSKKCTPLTATGIRYLLQRGVQPVPVILLVSHRFHLRSEFSPSFYHNVGELISPASSGRNLIQSSDASFYWMRSPSSRVTFSSRILM